MQSNTDKINAIGQLLKTTGQTLAVAESVTAGYLQAAFAEGMEASLFFQGGITAYNLGQKARHLLVEPIEAERTKCVSEKVACTMAKEVTALFRSDYGIAVTGFAAPVPEEGIDELYAWYAIARQHELLVCTRVTVPEMHKTQAKQYYLDVIIDRFYQLLTVA